MSVVVGLCLIIAVIAGGAVSLLLRRRAWAGLAILGTILAGGLAWLLHPVCVVIPDAELADFDPPIETRTDTGLIGQRYFQRRGSDWYHCKTWIERAFFF